MQFLGLGVDAGIAYQTLIKYPNVSTSELALSFAWPHERLRRALDELERFSLIRPSREQPDEPLLVSPEIALKELLDEQESDLDHHQRDVVRTRQLVASMISEYDRSQKNRSALPAQQLIGRDAVLVFTDDLAHSCATEIVAFTPGDSLIRDSSPAGRDADQELLGRGVRIRRLFLESIANDATAMSYVRWLIEQGGEARMVPSLPVRMTIYDRAAAMVAIDPHRSSEGAMLLRGTGVLTALCAFFDFAWGSGSELGVLPDRDDDGLTGQEREILRLLADGDTDAVVARKLGVSVRTTRRIIAELAERLGARSRFQIGAKAVEAGWLPGGR